MAHTMARISAHNFVPVEMVSLQESKDLIDKLCLQLRIYIPTGCSV
jgi:hypothetical protein